MEAGEYARSAALSSRVGGKFHHPPQSPAGPSARRLVFPLHSAGPRRPHPHRLLAARHPRQLRRGGMQRHLRHRQRTRPPRRTIPPLAPPRKTRPPHPPRLETAKAAVLTEREVALRPINQASILFVPFSTSEVHVGSGDLAECSPASLRSARVPFPRTAPLPIQRRFTEPRLDRIEVNVIQRPPVMRLVADEAVVIIQRPKRPSFAEQLVRLARSVPLPRLHQMPHRPTVSRADECVDMIRHDTPRDEHIPLAIEVPQRALHQPGHDRPPQMTRPVPGILIHRQPPVQFPPLPFPSLIAGLLPPLDPSQFLFPRRDHRQRHRIMQPEGDPLKQARLVTMRQIPAIVPPSRHMGSPGTRSCTSPRNLSRRCRSLRVHKMSVRLFYSCRRRSATSRSVAPP